MEGVRTILCDIRIWILSGLIEYMYNCSSKAWSRADRQKADSRGQLSMQLSYSNLESPHQSQCTGSIPSVEDRAGRTGFNVVPTDIIAYISKRF